MGANWAIFLILTLTKEKVKGKIMTFNFVNHQTPITGTVSSHRHWILLFQSKDHRPNISISEFSRCGGEVPGCRNLQSTKSRIPGKLQILLFCFFVDHTLLLFLITWYFNFLTSGFFEFDVDLLKDNTWMKGTVLEFQFIDNILSLCLVFASLIKEFVYLILPKLIP